MVVVVVREIDEGDDARYRPLHSTCFPSFRIRVVFVRLRILPEAETTTIHSFERVVPEGWIGSVWRLARQNGWRQGEEERAEGLSAEVPVDERRRETRGGGADAGRFIGWTNATFIRFVLSLAVRGSLCVCLSPCPSIGSTAGSVG